MAKFIEITFVDAQVTARARLLEEAMPRTCGELVKHLPFSGKVMHARYSGSEVAFFLPTHIRVDRERATNAVMPGDVAYIWLNRDDHYGLDDDVSEICWFYDRDAEPRMWEGPVRVNIFARLEGDTEQFYKASADTHISGAQDITITLIEE
jgi:hypothetical protein